MASVLGARLQARAGWIRNVGRIARGTSGAPIRGALSDNGGWAPILGGAAA